MKKTLIFAAVVVMVIGLGAASYAETDGIPEWVEQMRQWRQERMETALEDGLITQEQAQWRQQHWEEMDEWRAERGYDNDGFGFCHNGFWRGGFRRGMGGFGGGSRFNGSDQ